MGMHSTDRWRYRLRPRRPGMHLQSYLLNVVPQPQTRIYFSSYRPPLECEWTLFKKRVSLLSPTLLPWILSQQSVGPVKPDLGSEEFMCRLGGYLQTRQSEITRKNHSVDHHLSATFGPVGQMSGASVTRFPSDGTGSCSCHIETHMWQPYQTFNHCWVIWALPLQCLINWKRMADGNRRHTGHLNSYMRALFHSGS